MHLILSPFFPFYIAENYKILGKKDSALYYQERYFFTKDSIQNIGNFMAIAGRHSVEREKRDIILIDGLRDTVRLQGIILWLSAIIAILLLGGGSMLLIQNYKLKKSYKALWDKNKELDTAEDSNKDKVFAYQICENEKKSSGDGYQINAELEAKIMNVMENSEQWLAPDFSIQKLSKLVGSNTTYVSQLINERFGKNFRSFVNDYRIKEARRRLADSVGYGMMTIHAIGESVGFRSSTNFISAFRKQTGLTPSFYQKMARKEQEEAKKIPDL